MSDQDSPDAHLPAPAREPSEGALLRVSDAERNLAVDLLRQHCGEGRLTLDEFSDRVGAVFEARTRADLDRTVADLPPLPRPAPSVVEAASPSTRRVNRFTFAFMGGGQRRGRWRIEGRHVCVAFMGGCQLDLRGAEIAGDEVVITIVSFMGGAQVVVPEGVEVDLDGFSFLGGKSAKLDDRVPRTPGTPLVRVRAYSFMGGVAVRTKRSRTRRAATSPPPGAVPAIPAPPGALAVTDRPRRRDPDRARDDRRRRLREERKLLRDELKLKAEEEAVRRVRRHLNLEGAGSSAFGGPAALGASVGDAELTAVRRQLPPDGTVTILFSDIEGFTALTERLGDRAAQEILRDHNAIVRGQVTAHGGFEVKSNGDGFMVAFSGASRALRCAIGIQRELLAYNRNREEPVRVRMGLHTGDAIRQGNDFLGMTVNVASRIADVARGGEILASAVLRDLCAGVAEVGFADAREVELKGLSQPYTVYRATWE